MDSRSTSQQQTAVQIDDAFLADCATLYLPALIRNFQKRGAQPATAQDLAQDVFVRLAKRAKGGDIENPQAYVMQTASSVWNDHMRKRKVRAHNHHDEYEDYHHAPEVLSPERVLQGKEALKSIIAALNALPERTRDIYVLCRIRGLSRKEVADRFGMSVSGVDKHLINAKAHIAATFGDRT